MKFFVFRIYLYKRFIWLFAFCLYLNKIIFHSKNLRTIRKLYTFMVFNGNKYGLLTCIEMSWFFMIESKQIKGEELGVLHISKVVYKDKLMQELFNVVHLAIKDPHLSLVAPKIKCEIPLSCLSKKNAETIEKRHLALGNGQNIDKSTTGRTSRDNRRGISQNYEVKYSNTKQKIFEISFFNN